MLDLGRHYHDARRLTVSHPLFRVALARGHDADDLLQSVYLGILSRQQSRSAFNPARSALSKYLRLVAGSVLANILDKQRRRAVHEVGSVWIRGAESDPALAQYADHVAEEAHIAALIVADLGGDEQDRRVVSMLCLGFSVAEVRRAENGAFELVLADLRDYMASANNGG